MTTNATGTLTIDQAVMNIIKRASAPTRATLMKAAMDNMKKLKKARKEGMGAVEECAKMLKSAYVSKTARAELVKAGKKPKDDDGDADDFDFEKAMASLQKAYGAFEKVKVFGKAASNELAKAAGRSGQRGQEAGDGEAGFYEVPAGVTDLSPSAMAAAGPGSKGGGSQPPEYSGTGGVYPGKAAQFADKNGNIPLAVAELLAKTASLETTNEILSRTPTGRQRPYGFDMTKVFGSEPAGGGEVDPLRKAIIDSGVSVAALEEDEGARGKVIGQYMMNGSGAHSILDSNFKGRAGTRANG